MDTTTGYTYWVCVDCYEAHHGADEDGDHTPDREPLNLISEDVEVTSGLLWSEHEDECPGRLAHERGDCATEDDHECECEHQTFSWSRCEGCGSTLGGAREALTVWE